MDTAQKHPLVLPDGETPGPGDLGSVPEATEDGAHTSRYAARPNTPSSPYRLTSVGFAPDATWDDDAAELAGRRWGRRSVTYAAPGRGGSVGSCGSCSGRRARPGRRVASLAR